MKNQSIISTFILFAWLLSACHHNPYPAPLKFTAYEHNPILGPGEPGEWDELAVLVPSMLRHDNIFYMFYSGWQKNGQVSIGLATSEDGYHYKKYPGNPILNSRDKGYDSYHVSGPVFIREDSGWAMYYNAAETAIYSPGPFIGRAKAKELTGPWERMDKPVLERGRRSEWDGGYIFPSSILKKKDGTYMLWYTGGGNFTGRPTSYIGLATSADGINWIKYNDPATTDHPFADSDPVMINTNQCKQCKTYAWDAYIIKTPEGFEMYSGIRSDKIKESAFQIGYATSMDGIHWINYPENPVYTVKDDPYTVNNPEADICEGPSLVFKDSVCFMYYDYGQIINSIGVATARVPSTISFVP